LNASTLLPAQLFMLVVLYRLLDFRHAPDSLDQVYGIAPRLSMTTIALAFCGVGVALFLGYVVALIRPQREPDLR
jgi:hypothetical protein